MTDSTDTNDISSDDIEELFSQVHDEKELSRTKSLNRLHTISQNQPEMIDAKLVAEHIQRSNRMLVKRRLYSVANLTIEERPSSATELFSVIQDDLISPNIGDRPSEKDVRLMLGYIHNILYLAASSGVEITPQVLEKLYFSVVEYPKVTPAERTVDILGSLVSNGAQVADEATEILIGLSDIPDDDEISQQFKKWATAGLYGLLEEDEIPESADRERIKDLIEQNKSLLENK